MRGHSICLNFHKPIIQNITCLEFLSEMCWQLKLLRSCFKRLNCCNQHILFYAKNILKCLECYLLSSSLSNLHNFILAIHLYFLFFFQCEGGFHMGTFLHDHQFWMQETLVVCVCVFLLQTWAVQNPLTKADISSCKQEPPSKVNFPIARGESRGRGWVVIWRFRVWQVDFCYSYIKSVNAHPGIVGRTSEIF